MTLSYGLTKPSAIWASFARICLLWVSLHCGKSTACRLMRSYDRGLSGSQK